MSKYLRQGLDVFKSQAKPLPLHQLYKYKTRFSTIGTPGAGKTTVAAGICLTAQTLSAVDPSFCCRILETTSGIREAVSNLRRGRFPPKTLAAASMAFEAGLLMRKEGRWGNKQIHIPICDIAGEDMLQMMSRYSKNMYTPTYDAFNSAANLVNYVKESDGFILIVPAPRALMFADDVQIEREPEDAQHDPDVNLARMLDEILQHKDQSHGRPIKGIAVVVTKWDLIAPFAANFGMDIYDPSGEGMRRFMDVCFPDTSMSLKSMGNVPIQFFPSYFQTMRNADGSARKWDDGGDRVEVKPEERKPKYSEDSYVQLINWALRFAS